MTRRLAWLAIALLGLAWLAIPDAAAHHKPGHGHGPPTTTTAATTTTLPAATTTTEAMPTTSVTMGPYAGPVTISTGGVYTGRWRSTTPGTPAVTIATTAPVVIDHADIAHISYGIYAQSTTGTNVTVRSTSFQALQPATAVNQYALYLLSPASVVFEHNYLKDGHGFLVNGNNVNANPIRIRYNDYVDIGRYSYTELVGAVHFDKVTASSGAEIAWNRVANHYGHSASEDVIGIVSSNGGGTAGTRIEVHHNLIDGSYPLSGDGASYTGGGIDLGDVLGSWQVSHDNTVVRITNNCLMIPNGNDLEHYNNRVVQSGIADDGTRVSSTFGAGLMVWDNPSYVGSPTNATLHHNSSNLRRWTGVAWERSNAFMPDCNPAGTCTNNVQGTFDNANWDTPTNGTTLGLTDDAAWLAEINDALADWEAARAAAGVTIGPLP